MATDEEVLEAVHTYLSTDNDEAIEMVKRFHNKKTANNYSSLVTTDDIKKAWKERLPRYVIREICLISNSANANQKAIARKLGKDKPISAPDEMKSIDRRISEALKTLPTRAAKEAKKIAKCKNLSLKEKKVAAVLICEGYSYEQILKNIKEKMNDEKIKIQVVQDQSISATMQDMVPLLINMASITNYVFRGGEKPALEQTSGIPGLDAHKLKRAAQKGLIAYLRNKKN